MAAEAAAALAPQAAEMVMISIRSQQKRPSHRWMAAAVEVVMALAALTPQAAEMVMVPIRLQQKRQSHRWMAAAAAAAAMALAALARQTALTAIAAQCCWSLAVAEKIAFLFFEFLLWFFVSYTVKTRKTRVFIM